MQTWAGGQARLPAPKLKRLVMGQTWRMKASCDLMRYGALRGGSVSLGVRLHPCGDGHSRLFFCCGYTSGSSCESSER